MKINLSPQRRDDTLSMSRAGAVLTVNGEAFDFSAMSAGDTLPLGAVKSSWFVGPVENVDGELEMTIILPLPFNYSPEQAFPQPLIDVPDGPVLLPQPLPEAQLRQVLDQLNEGLEA